MNRSTQVLATADWLELVEVDGWEYVKRRNIAGIVAIVAVNQHDALVLVEQYRPAIARRVLELPAGLVGDLPGARNEPLAAAARRELLEETGYEANELVYLMEGPASPGMSSELVTFFRATGVRKIQAGGGDETEDITVREMPLEHVDAWLQERARSGVLIDPKVYLGVHFALKA